MSTRSALSDTDEEIEEDVQSISEHISFDSNVESSEGAAGGISISAQAQMKRHLFDIEYDDDDDDLDGTLFKVDDALLSGGKIAQHFKISEQDSEDSLEVAVTLNATNSHRSTDEHNEQSDRNSITASKENENKNVSDEIQAPLQKQQQQNSTSNSSKLEIGNVVENSLKGIVAKNSSTIASTNNQLIKKDLSPFKYDVIPINHDKISLDTLKHLNIIPPSVPIKIQDPDDDGSTTNQNTTNDISDIGCDEDISLGYFAEEDTLRLMRKNSKSYEFEKDRCQKKLSSRSLNNSFKFESNASEDSSCEEDHSIEEVMVSNASIITSLNRVTELVAMANDSIDNFSPHNEQLSDINIDINDEEEMNKILSDTIENLPAEIFDPQQPPDSLDYVSDGIFELKDKIRELIAKQPNARLVNKNSFETVDDDDEQQEPVAITVKQMEKIDCSKEVLEDISEKSDVSLEPKIEKEEPSLAEIQEYGTEIRKILQNNQHILISNSNNILGNVSEKLLVDEENVTSFDSVISLNMLQAFENKIKELEEIVATKDVCLAALNMQLDTFYRRDSVKDGPATALDSCSLATSSTEYRTYQDDYVNKVCSVHFKVRHNYFFLF